MNKFLNQLIDMHLGSLMVKSRNKIALSDKLYKKDEEELGKRYEALELGQEEHILINDHIACLTSREHRLADISYLAGVRDT